LSQSGIVTGTPMFMAPEQANGQPLDHRADLFSLGSVLYTLCTGRPPFRANSTLAVLKRLAEDAPRPIPEITPEAPGWLCDVIARLHAKKPEDRFSSAREVAELLARHLAPTQHPGNFAAPRVAAPAAVKRPPPPESPQAAPAIRPRSRVGRWMVAAGALMLLGGLGLTEATGVTRVGGTVIRLFSPEGTLVVEVDDPGVSIKIDGSEIVITGAGAREIRLKPGNYTVEARKDGKVVRQELVTVTKNGRQVVRISKETPPAEANDAKPTAASLRERSVAGLPAEDQFDLVRKELKKRNPKFNGRIEHALVDDRVHTLTIEGPGLRDIAPLRALRRLQNLNFNCPEVADLSPLRGMGLTHLALYNSSVSDLSPLRGMKLRALEMSGSRKVEDLSPLRGMPLEVLTIYGTRVKDLSPLKGNTKLDYLNCDSSRVVDLSPLKGMALRSLNVSRGKVSDLSPLEGMLLTELAIEGSAVTDLSPIKGLPLKVINCDFQATRDAKVLRAIRTLEKINRKPAEQFWQEVDAKARGR
jgi:Leucine-rich repeat (LRR) protein